MTPVPSRCGLHFSLRTLLLLVAACCVWLSMQAKWMRDRHAAKQWIVRHESRGWSDIDATDVQVQRKVNGRSVWVSASETERDVQWTLAIFGERPLNFIFLDKSKLSKRDCAQLDALQTLFPEAAGIHIEEPGLTTRWPPQDMDSFFVSAAHPALDPRPRSGKLMGSQRFAASDNR